MTRITTSGASRLQLSGRGKRRALALALLMGLGLQPAVAQQPAAPAQTPQQQPSQPLPPVSHLAAARDLLILTGTASAFTNIFNEFQVNLQRSLVTRPEVMADLEQVLTAMKPEVDKRVNEMLAIATLTFARGMSEADLKEVKAFFESPIGRRYTEARPQIINEVFSQLQPWTLRTTDYMYNTLRDEMKKRGHEIGG